MIDLLGKALDDFNSVVSNLRTQTDQVIQKRQETLSRRAIAEINNLNADFLLRVDSADPSKRLDPANWEKDLQDHFATIDSYIDSLDFSPAKEMTRSIAEESKASLTMQFGAAMNQRLLNQSVVDSLEEHDAIANGNASPDDKYMGLFGEGGWYERQEAFGAIDPAKLSNYKKIDTRAWALDSVERSAKSLNDPEQAIAYLSNEENIALKTPDGKSYKISDEDRQQLLQRMEVDWQKTSQATSAQFAQTLEKERQKSGVVDIEGGLRWIADSGADEGTKLSMTQSLYKSSGNLMTEAYNARISRNLMNESSLKQLYTELQNSKRKEWGYIGEDERTKLLNRISTNLAALEKDDTKGAASMARANINDIARKYTDGVPMDLTLPDGSTVTRKPTLSEAMWAIRKISFDTPESAEAADSAIKFITSSSSLPEPLRAAIKTIDDTIPALLYGKSKDKLTPEDKAEVSRRVYQASSHMEAWGMEHRGASRAEMENELNSYLGAITASSLDVFRTSLQDGMGGADAAWKKIGLQLSSLAPLVNEIGTELEIPFDMQSTIKQAWALEQKQADAYGLGLDKAVKSFENGQTEWKLGDATYYFRYEKGKDPSLIKRVGNKEEVIPNPNTGKRKPATQPPAPAKATQPTLTPSLQKTQYDSLGRSIERQTVEEVLQRVADEKKERLKKAGAEQTFSKEQLDAAANWTPGSMY